ncbi:MAG: hypothetical protein A2509_03080 [Candidatus Edwardsbacteria bacterium RIFOXYD12_FULL_50_11]|uniref:Uncharacterized protein n=1 Tax=Candidatus Edwardsbacteria bacterium GWF2_54_11 TaxID=1817851 RepID=A0A1F5RHS4_9BACT|nr:MAG: hypothetical protein A2502_06945 [Candidatus Edwardsbacteria bacterium RifOxyC12_full_54_24]OGF06968.1 MAG: hypothetical protein A2273_08485 [Candidatus Edwardsbacteria bacterium RifOxyA12_full_54_48]OGF11066.1 MAG: hypothetical protein A3K15_08025 [Candidatus Edwardsbacteria bacterium GWE2_54_12]OGF14035.1 MAG: hypothetical protein A2024_05740 [Candidatus Edwardsbacteria bacterium GWF2_54_11]OGF16012.1 MAG: hypothetical protein A2509_03080 [Candidatus Edwardsbacteria bacterium RIFOXYD1
MALYFLEYDLRKDRDYQKLYDELNKFNAVRILKSLWCFNRINITSEGLRDYFKQFIDSDDGLMVAEVTSWATTNSEGTPNQLK